MFTGQRFEFNCLQNSSALFIVHPSIQAVWRTCICAPPSLSEVSLILTLKQAAVVLVDILVASRLASTERSHALVGPGSAALAAALYPLTVNPSFSPWINKVVQTETSGKSYTYSTVLTRLLPSVASSPPSQKVAYLDCSVPLCLIFLFLFFFSSLYTSQCPYLFGQMMQQLQV